jgi:hypothetical protein
VKARLPSPSGHLEAPTSRFNASTGPVGVRAITVKTTHILIVRGLVVTNTLWRLHHFERIAARNLKEAFEEARSRKTISQGDRRLVEKNKASDLNAANPFARILLGKHLWAEFERHFGLSDIRPLPDEPLYWVTLADVRCMTDLDQRNVDVADMNQGLRRGLKGLSYIGIMDLGLYANIQPGTRYCKRSCVSWHLHLFAWGETRREIKARAKRMNDLPNNYRPIIPRPQGKGFDWSQVTAENIAWRFPYMCKTPRKAYRIGRLKDATGNEASNPLFRSNKSDLRPGQRITLFNLLKRHDLDDLLIAGGEGVAIRRRAIRAALKVR